MSAQPNSKKVLVTYQTPAFRLSYPALFEPTVAPGGTKAKFGITLLFPKKSTAEALKAAKHPASTWILADNCAGFWQEICKVARANFGPEVDLKTLKLPKFRDGDKPKESGKLDENEKGYIVARSTTETRPDCLRGDKTRITAENSGELYPGCWVRAVLTISPFVHPVGGRGVTIYLAGVQKLADDLTFSSRPRVEDEFDAVAAEGQEGTGAEVVNSEELPF